MKFGQQLISRSVEAWREQYVCYNRLKRILSKLKSSRRELKRKSSLSLQVPPNANSETEQLLALSFKHGDPKTEFWDLLERELAKVDAFYSLKLEELKEKCNAIARAPKPMATSPQKQRGKKDTRGITGKGKGGMHKNSGGFPA
jgi:SPX domain protein involved in polyphosphate accumulation